MDDKYGMLLEKVLDKRNRIIQIIEGFPIYLYLGKKELNIVTLKYLNDKNIYFPMDMNYIFTDIILFIYLTHF